MARKKKSWTEKLADAKAKDDLPKIFFCEKSKQHFYVPSPAIIEREIRGSADRACRSGRRTARV